MTTFNDLAVILAAGMGKRMKGFSRKPKSLIKIGSKPIIEKIIEALISRKTVEKIIIIVGYRSCQFNYLIKKYENLYLIKQPKYQIKYFSYLPEALKKFWKPNKNWIILSADMILPENYFLKSIPINTMSAFFFPNLQNKKNLIYELNKNKKIIGVKSSFARNILILGEFSYLDSEITKEIIFRKIPKIKRKKMQGFNQIIMSAKAINKTLSYYLLKWYGVSDIDNQNNLNTAKHLWKNFKF